MQRAMVLASLRAPRSGAYVLQRIWERDEPWELPLLEIAWRRVIERHAALRTRISERADGTWAMQIEEVPPIVWEVSDGGDLADFLRADRERGFAFQDGVPMRLTIRPTPGGSTLVWTVHHALLDGRSVIVVWRELTEIYDGLRRGDAAVMADAPDLRRYLDGLARQDFSRSEGYWRRLWEGVTETTGYVVDRLRPAAPAAADAVAKEIRQVDEGFTQGLETLAARLDVTVNTLVQAAWALLLSRYSGRKDVVFGVTRHCRDGGTRNLVGPLMNTVPFRVKVDGEAPVAEWLRQIRSRWVELREHEQTPMDRIRACSSLPPGMPPYESVVVYDHEPAGEGLRGRGRFRSEERTDSTLTLAAWGKPVLKLQIVYHTGLYCSETVAGILGQMEEVLRSFVERPEAPVNAANLLSRAEKTRLTMEWKAAATAIPADVCAHRLFEEQAARIPGKIALEGHRSWSYGEANRQANRLARLLRERGAGPGDFIAVKLPSSPEAVLAILGVMKAGAAFLPLDPAQPGERLAGMIERAAPKLVIDDWAALENQMAAQAGEDLLPLASPGDAAYAIYTSGSTGTPKAVVMTHRGLLNHTLAMARAQAIGEGDRRLQFASMGSDVVVAEIFNYLTSGATLVFGRERAGSSMSEFLRFLDERRITITGVPSTWWKEWVAALSAGTAVMPRFLRAVNTGMERVDAAAFREWRRGVGNRVRWFNVYGPTETLTALLYEAGSSTWEGGDFVPIGRPIANLRAYVLDEYRSPAPAGIPGEVYIGGAGVARGYLGDDSLTASRFVPDCFPEEPGGRMYRTGDLAFRLPDGNLVFVGRVDRQLKIRGFRVEPEEVEAALGQHPTIRHCAVEAGNDRLAAYVVFRGDLPVPTLEELRAHMARSVPAYMAPQEYRVLDEMPFTASGKIDRMALPREARTLRSPEGRLPSTETENRLAPIWKRAIGRAEIPVNENFFESGGDSLRATSLIAAVAREFGRELSLSALLRVPTMAQLAAELDSECISAAVYHAGGSETPFFAISSAHDDALAFAALARELGSSRPLIALRSPVEDCVLPMEELAARVCRTVRTMRPKGPYVLAGFCFGGMVAFEAARQLSSAGAEVQMVVLFDTPRPGYPRFLGTSSGEWRKRLGRTGLLTPLGHSGGLAASAVTAARAYVPGTIGVPVAQFKIRAMPAHWRWLGDPRLAWRGLCPRGFHVHELQGEHGHPYFERHGVEIASVLSTLR